MSKDIKPKSRWNIYKRSNHQLLTRAVLGSNEQEAFNNSNLKLQIEECDIEPLVWSPIENLKISPKYE